MHFLLPAPWVQGLRSGLRVPMLAAGLGLLWPDMGLAQATAAAPPVINTELRLPGIRAYFKRPDDMPKPRITLEELGQCMGDNQQLRAQVRELTARRDALVEGRKPLEAEHLAIQQAGRDIDAQRESLSQDMAAHDRAAQALERRRAPLQAQNAQPVSSAAQARQRQADIQQFNAELRHQQTRNQGLITRQRNFNQTVTAHNARLAALGSQGSLWEAQWRNWVNDTQALDAEGQRMNQQCGGAREVVKPDVNPEALP
jgi:chromosome segregation ATPase